MSLMERVEMEAAFLLHARPYRETSQILEILSQNHGRIGLVAKGSRRPKSRWKNALRPFQLCQMSWSGRGELYTLRAAETFGPPAQVRGMPLMAAYYMNELLIALMHRSDPHPNLFTHYGGALASLGNAADTELVLRRFEVALLAEIGYGIVVEHDVVDERPLDAERKYEYVIERGPVPVPDTHSGELVFRGSELLAIANGDRLDVDQLRSAKRLLRAVLNSSLGGRPLKTRQVLAAMQR
jgi:DNA repair protein RecO (recombination protein O)